MIQLWVLKNWCKNTFPIQKKKAFEDSYDKFKSKKIKERFGNLCIELGFSSPKYNECKSYERSIWRFHEKEGNAYRKSLEARYQKIEERAKEDFTNTPMALDAHRISQWNWSEAPGGLQREPQEAPQRGS